ncbi:MAG: hypothetical protein JNL82_33700 [Myxococcales bacterium]|nr:hypothetical protein [Myxococcales bacterium]
MQDKQVPCRIAGCPNTWTWFAAQQIRGFGQPPPDRMCDEHLAQFNELADREVPCRTPGCPNTWLWKRGAQLAELQRTGKLRRPSRLCAECFNAERETHDQELPCKIDGCRRSWTWTRDAQLRHRLWVLRQRAKAARPAPEPTPAEAGPEVLVLRGSGRAVPAGEAADEAVPANLSEGAAETPTEVTARASEASEAPTEVKAEASTEVTARASEPAEEGDDRRKRRRKRRRGGKVVANPEGPPERMCGLCAAKLSRLQAKELPCKVHGCTRSWTWDRASQMRAWVNSGSDDVDYDPPSPKRMCEVCREFCRTHPDREVACGRPGCTSTWTYKTGAQLQAFLAGRTADPLKLCGECAKGEFAASFRPSGDAVPEGAEIMPCVVSGCDGTWVYIPGMKLRDTPYGELSTDRMCPKCRRERGLDGGDAPVEVTAADLEPDPAEEDHEEHDDLAHDEASHDEATTDEAGAPEEEAILKADTIVDEIVVLRDPAGAPDEADGPTSG